VVPTTYERKARSPAGRQEGQSLVEFTIGLLVMLLLIFGIIDLSRAVFARNALASAAREAARYAVVHPTADAAEIAGVAKTLIAGLDPKAIYVGVSYPDTATVRVEVTYTFHAVTPLIGQLVDGGSGAGITLRGRSQMMVERRD
jgi:Flp pilus assembly protein TadG